MTVEIAGQRYPIRSELEERYVTELAAYVDLKMRAASDAAPASDMLGLAVLVALTLPTPHAKIPQAPALLVMVFGGSSEPTFHQSEPRGRALCMPLNRGSLKRGL